MIGTRTLLWRWLRCGRNGTQQAWRDQRLRLVAGFGVLLVVWALVFGLTWGLIDFLDRNHQQFKAALIDNLIILLFLILAVLVTLSATIITWSSLFRTPGSKFLAQLPVSNRALYWHAAIEGGTWASWALLVLGMPILLALSREAATPWLYCLAATLTLLIFQWCCIGCGALGAVVLARLIPLLRKGIRGFISIIVVAAGVGAIFLAGELQPEQASVGFVRQVVADIGFIDNPYLPPRWVGLGLQSAINGDWLSWLHFMVLVATFGGSAAIIGERIAARRLRIDLDLLTGRPESRGGRNGSKGKSQAWKLLPMLPADLSLMVAKDWRLFRRDPAQVLQMGLFVAMLTIYIFMLPRIGQAFQSIPWWGRAVSVLNICAISMALATFTGRFVYPMLSLEGRRMWVLAFGPVVIESIDLRKVCFCHGRRNAVCRGPRDAEWSFSRIINCGDYLSGARHLRYRRKFIGCGYWFRGALCRLP